MHLKKCHARISSRMLLLWFLSKMKKKEKKKLIYLIIKKITKNTNNISVKYIKD